MLQKIKKIHADEILDSRGNPTVEATVLLKDGTVASASVPSGASTGTHEAHELRDNDKKRYGGKGVLKAVKNVKTIIADALHGMDVLDQTGIDARMIALDGTPNKKRLGANAILAVSLACARAGAKAKKMPLYAYLRERFEIPSQTYRIPVPTMNILNGGAHANWVLDVQEFMIVPQQKTFAEQLRCGSEVFHALGALLKKRKLGTQVGDEGGYAVSLPTNEDGLKLLLEAISAAGYRTGKDVKLATDVAASELYDEKKRVYRFAHEGKVLRRGGVIKMYEQWIKKYPIMSLEDGLREDCWQGWKEMTKRLGGKVAVVGDDFFATNVARLQKGIKQRAANAILIKVNQIGSLSETMATIFLAQQNGYKVSVSHRSGETEDDFIADLAVAVNADFVKFGSLSRSERLAKYNRLLEIEEEVGPSRN